MNYETARKLKDAGFPQEGDGMFTDEHENIQTIRSSGFQMYIPTLSELIEACGDGEHEVRLIWSFKEKWCASQEGLTFPNGKFEMGVEIFDCPTPEEAVANLYLALHPSE